MEPKHQYRCNSEDRWLKVGDMDMHYLDWGGSGEPVVALHGLASSCHWYDLVIPYLTDSFKVVALDQRAHGQTGQPSTGYDWDTLAADVVSALDQMGIERAAILGHSWGGSVALSVAALHPDRVSALALIDGGFSAGPRSPDMTWEDFKARLSPRDIYGPAGRYLGALQRQFDHCWCDELEHMVMSMVGINADGTTYERLQPGNHEQVLWAMWSDPTHQKLPQVQCPTLIVAGERRPRDGNEELLRRREEQVSSAQSVIPDCQVAWIADSSHDIGYEKPKELADALAGFLSSNTTPQ